MLLTLLQFFASKFLVLALHLEAGSFPRPLSPQEEIRAFANLRAGDSSAREKLIRHNLRLVAHIAKKYYIKMRIAFMKDKAMKNYIIIIRKH